MKFSLKRFSPILLSMVLILTSIPLTAFASEEYHMSTATALPSAPLVASATVPGVVGNAIVTLTIEPGKTLNSIYVVGNKTGGGANTSASFLGIGVNSKAKLDGQWHQIASGLNLTSTSTNKRSITISIVIDDTSTPYNIAFAGY